MSSRPVDMLGFSCSSLTAFDYETSFTASLPVSGEIKNGFWLSKNGNHCGLKCHTHHAFTLAVEALRQECFCVHDCFNSNDFLPRMRAISPLQHDARSSFRTFPYARLLDYGGHTVKRIAEEKKHFDLQ
jgi:hypothetical protein